MAGTNDFKAFATDANANVTSQEEWETLTALKKGFSSGKASSAQVSKALRQPSTMAAVLGQFIANAELDALDDGDVDGLVAKLATAITTNLGLGEAAKRAVGTGENQIPDMSSFPLTVTGDLSSIKLTTKLPNGLILKAVNGNSDSNGWFSLNFDTPFPREILFCWAADRRPVSSQNQISVINANINLSAVDHVAGYARAINSGGAVGPVAAAISAYALGR